MQNEPHLFLYRAQLTNVNLDIYSHISDWLILSIHISGIFIYILKHSRPNSEIYNAYKKIV